MTELIVQRTPNNGYQDGPATFMKNPETGRECMVAGERSFWYVQTSSGEVNSTHTTKREALAAGKSYLTDEA